MTSTTLGLIAFAIAVGCLPPIQAGVNATIAGHHGHPLWGALTNTVVASLTLLVIIVAMRVPTAGVRGLADAPAWSWLGGTMGAVMVLSAIILAPRLGAAAYVSAMVVGTVAASLTIDHFGLIGFPVRPASVQRMIGGALVIIGMIAVQTD
jgi:transporter family-2 protein